MNNNSQKCLRTAVKFLISENLPHISPEHSLETPYMTIRAQNQTLKADRNALRQGFTNLFLNGK